MSIVALLLMHGADRTAKGCHGTPAESACSQTIITMLERAPDTMNECVALLFPADSALVLLIDFSSILCFALSSYVNTRMVFIPCHGLTIVFYAIVLLLFG